MTIKLILTIIGLVGLFISLREKGIFQKIITTGLFLSILLTWVADKITLFYSLLLLLGLSIASLIYGLTTKALTRDERLIISSTGFLFTVGTIFKIQHYPGQVLFRILLIISITAYIVHAIKSINMLTKERGFMLIWTALAIDQLINLSQILR